MVIFSFLSRGGAPSGGENSVHAMPLLLREDDVARVLQMDRVIAAVEEAFRQLGSQQAINRPRQRSTTVAGTILNVMSAAIPPLQVMGLKTYTSARGGTRFIGMLYSTDTGELLAMIEANRLGQMRTGAVSGGGRACISTRSDRTGRTGVSLTAAR